MSSQGSTVSSFALYGSMINDQSQSHVCIRTEVHAFPAQSPGLGQSACVFEVTETDWDKNTFREFNTATIRDKNNVTAKW